MKKSKKQKGIIILGFGLMMLALCLTINEILKEEDGVMSLADYISMPILITGLFLVLFGANIFGTNKEK